MVGLNLGVKTNSFPNVKYFVFEPMFGYNYSNGSQTTKTKSDNGTVNEIESDLPSISNLGLTLGISFLIGDE